MDDDQPPPRFDVAVVDGGGRAVRVPGLARWLAGVAPRSTRGTLTIALVSDARMRALNREYRGRDYATDVLSFPAAPSDGSGAATPAPGSRLTAPGTRRDPLGPRLPAPGPRAPAALPVHLGDLAIARGVAARQAREAGHPVSVEYRVLALHGLLHLLGYDHETDDGTMRRVEARLRRRGRLPGGLLERATR